MPQLESPQTIIGYQEDVLNMIQKFKILKMQGTQNSLFTFSEKRPPKLRFTQAWCEAGPGLAPWPAASLWGLTLTPTLPP